MLYFSSIFAPNKIVSTYRFLILILFCVGSLSKLQYWIISNIIVIRLFEKHVVGFVSTLLFLLWTPLYTIYYNMYVCTSISYTIIAYCYNSYCNEKKNIRIDNNSDHKSKNVLFRIDGRVHMTVLPLTTIIIFCI